jgi:hypothetical protein
MISDFMVALLKDKPKEVLPDTFIFFTSSQFELD